MLESDEVFDISTNENEDLTNNFKRYTIGFDAQFLKILRNLLGYRLFNAIIRLKILNRSKRKYAEKPFWAAYLFIFIGHKYATLLN
jgi:hypothetical protein